MEGEQDQECGISLEQLQFGGILWEENGTGESGKMGRNEGFWEWGQQDIGIRRQREESSVLGWDLWLIGLGIPTGV